jgi:hypothetical protein
MHQKHERTIAPYAQLSSGKATVGVKCSSVTTASSQLAAQTTTAVDLAQPTAS